MVLQSTVEVPSTGDAVDNEDVAVTSAAGGVVLLEPNQHRKSALIINTGDAAIRVTTDGSAPTATRGKRISAGGALTLSAPYCPTKQVRAIAETATTSMANASEVH